VNGEVWPTKELTEPALLEMSGYAGDLNWPAQQQPRIPLALE
jgi:hypothetical protein